MNGNNDIRFTYSEYDRKADRIFFGLFSEFRDKVDLLDRDGDENVFQLLRANYKKKLKQQLEVYANLLITNCDLAELQGRLRINFAEKINYLLREFVRKSEML